MTKLSNRPISVIESELAAAREAYAKTGPTHVSVNRCERLYSELIEAKQQAHAHSKG